MPWDPGRNYTVPWQWGSTGIAVNADAYSGDINTSAIFLDPPDELVGKVNVAPEMNDVLSLALMYVGGEPCTEDTEMLKKARDALMAAKPNWQSMDYGMTTKLAANDVMASIYWNGAIFRARLQNDKVKYGYPKEGFPLWMDSVALLSDATNVDEAYQFMNFIMEPENAALISAFARYANGIDRVRSVHARGHEGRARDRDPRRVSGGGSLPADLLGQGAGILHRDLDRTAEITFPHLTRTAGAPYGAPFAFRKIGLSAIES